MSGKRGDLWVSVEEWIITIVALLGLPAWVFSVISLACTGGKW